jgi:CRP-like cAMP-binding protein
MTSDDKRDILEETSIFGNCEDEVVSAAVSCSEYVTYDPDEVVYEEGEVSTDAFVLSDGSVRVDRPVREKKDTAFIARRADLFGFLSALTGEPRRTTATVGSDEEAHCICVDVARLMDQLEDNGSHIRSFYDEVTGLMFSRLLRSSKIIDTLL